MIRKGTNSCNNASCGKNKILSNKLNKVLKSFNAKIISAFKKVKTKIKETKEKVRK